IDLAGDAGAAPAIGAEASDAPRRALLLYQEGTAEEQIYPFTGDTLTIGRGRENDIQIKNDSKVSRYHCKLFRRGNNFYIEDQKSSNGSLVNGELITDRRLFGGEEIIIGETFFRFRIME
ncbi:MAG: FHA domain-containing protein, partial [Myxococcota bacterium]